MIAAAMHIAPGFPNADFIAATAPEPIKSARTRFRPGFRTSLPRNVTFVQAVWAKIGPTIDLPRSRMIASPPTNLNPGCATCGLQPFAHESHHADVRAADA